MNAREGWEVCGYCGEPLDELGDSRRVMNMPTHEECALRMILGGVNHLRGLCTCCGGTLPPDPEGMPKRKAAMVAALYHRAKEQTLREVARRICHEFGVPWYDPRTGERHDPPAS